MTFDKRLREGVRSGRITVVDLLKIAKHGRGENVYLIRFHYVPPARRRR